MPLKSEASKSRWLLTPADRKAFRLASLVVACVVVAVSLFGGLSYDRTRATARESAHWPTVDGTITESYSRRAGSNNSIPEAVIRYRYTVDGRTYEGGRVDAKMGAEEAGSIVARYPVGKEVQVHYDLAEHSRALLEPGEEAAKTLQGTLFLIVFELVMLGFVGLIVWVRYRVTAAPFDGERYVVFGPGSSEDRP